MKRKVIAIVLVIVIAAAVIGGVFVFRNKNNSPEPMVESVTAETTKKEIQVPSINEEKAESSKTTETEPAITQGVQTDSLNNDYTLPNKNKPKDNPPDDSQILKKGDKKK